MNTLTTTRIQSIDLLRGIAIVVMALDHVRDYFHEDASYFIPTDVELTNTALFATRFITNYCAPVFCFLAGTSAFFVGQKKDLNSLSIWLIKRGLWLIILELSVIKFAWYFMMDLTFIDLAVIWSLGVSMIFLAGFIHLPANFVIPLCLSIAIGHNLLDGFRPAGETMLEKIWITLHVESSFQLGSITIYAVYPLLPWIALMALGYYFGKFYTRTFNKQLREKTLIAIGSILIIAFFIFRAFGSYGDQNVWINHPSLEKSVFSFLNVTKYPPSFLFLAITIGPALIMLAMLENLNNRITKMLATIGQVPLFFYVIHIYAIHIIAMFAAQIQGFGFESMILPVWIGIPEASQLKGYGFTLPIVYVIWILIVVALYPLCARFNDYKKTHPEKWWLSYL